MLSGCGKTNLIVCPYHAWVYDLEGSLCNARNTKRVRNFNSDDFRLRNVRIEEFCGLIFVNPDPAAPSFKE